ncbi:MAG TPA: DUF4340 domain-containing protein [Polyangiales bacterium]|nr:DUF4340 domain-containing protein [Polyangiales bacterium]
MNSSRIFIALAVLVGLGVAVTTTLRSREAKTTVEAPKATLTAPKKDEITELSIARPKQDVITLKKQGDQWRLSAPVDAEAAQSAVDSALDRLAELKITGVAATKKENHTRLEVDAEHGLHVIAKGGEQKLLDLYIGQAKSGGTMLRPEGSDEVLIAKGSFRYVFDKEAKEFRKREVTELDTAELTSFSVSSPKGSFKFVKQGEAWAQAPGEKKIEKFDHAQAQAFASTASNLRAQDFAAASDDTGLASPQSKVMLTKKDGSTVEILVGKPTAKGDDYYVKTSQGDVVYQVAKFSAERLQPDAKFFEKQPPPPPPPAGAQGGMPPGMMPHGMGGPGGGQISPEMMQQIQRQIQAQQAQGGQ